ncbi:MAG: hypothetical protein J6X35_06340 [Bacteroidales bacterium]|nr:hypothetical protein [Bacteroidales bacterium]
MKNKYLLVIFMLLTTFCTITAKKHEVEEPIIMTEIVTNPSGMYTSDDFYTYLSSESIGEAFRDWWISSLGNNHTNYKISWFYGMTLLGDPTINFRHQVSDVCVENLALNEFPSNNNSNLVLFKAGSTIYVSENFEIPSGVHVIFVITIVLG